MYNFLTYLLLVISPSVNDLSFYSLVVNQTDRILSRGKWSLYIFHWFILLFLFQKWAMGFRTPRVSCTRSTWMPWPRCRWPTWKESVTRSHGGRWDSAPQFLVLRNVLGYQRTTNIKILSIRVGVPLYGGLLCPQKETQLKTVNITYNVDNHSSKYIP